MSFAIFILLYTYRWLLQGKMQDLESKATQDGIQRKMGDRKNF